MAFIYRPPTTVAAPSAAWVRPSDWLPMPSVVDGDQIVVGLHRVTDTDGNFVAISCTGAFSVDWGDGAGFINFASGAVASNNLLWANYSGSTLTSEGFRQAIITVQPQSGQTLTSVNFNTTHPQPGLSSTFIRGWLDIAMAGSSINAIGLSSMQMLQRFVFVGNHLMSNFSNFLTNCSNLQSVPLFNTTGVTNFSNFLNGCGNLQSVPLFNTANVTTFSSFLRGCGNLQSVPLFNTASVNNFSSFLQSCGNLQSVPLFNTASGNNFSSFLRDCGNLQSVPPFDTANVTNFSSFLQGCRLTSFLATGMTRGFSLSSTVLSRDSLVTVFNNLGTAAGAQSITITGNYGAASLTAGDLEIATNKGWTVNN